MEITHPFPLNRLCMMMDAEVQPLYSTVFESGQGCREREADCEKG